MMIMITIIITTSQASFLQHAKDVLGCPTKNGCYIVMFYTVTPSLKSAQQNNNSAHTEVYPVHYNSEKGNKTQSHLYTFVDIS